MNLPSLFWEGVRVALGRGQAASDQATSPSQQLSVGVRLPNQSLPGAAPTVPCSPFSPGF